MKIDFGSDLHVDINQPRIGGIDFERYKNDGSEVLVIAGDIANSAPLAIETMIAASKVYDHVVFVDGNHEHYVNIRTGMNVSKTMDYIKSSVKKRTNITYLHGDNSVLINGVLFVGVNAWYDFKMIPKQYNSASAKIVWRHHLNDERLAVFDKQPEVFAEEQTDALAQQVANYQNDDMIEKIVVVTHTVPHEKGLLVKHDPIWDQLNGAFGCTAMKKVYDADINNKIVYSLFGHTHYPYDFDEYGTVRFIANPRGYHGIDGDSSRWRLLQLEI